MILPYHSGDLIAARRLLGWIKYLGGCKTACVLLRDARMQDNGGMRMLADRTFEKVEELQPPHPLPDETWPIGANWMFETACRHMAKVGAPFLWLEPDAIPTREGWFDELTDVYHRCGQPFMGTFISSKDPLYPSVHLNGIAIYPANALDYFPGFEMQRDVPWDLRTAKPVTQAFDTPLIQHFWGEPNLPPTFRAFRSKDDPKNALTLDFINPKAAIFHRNKDGTLIHLLRDQGKMISTELVGRQQNPPFTGLIKPGQNVSHIGGLTVVITNFQRPEFLKAAFGSVLAAGVSKVVVSSSGATTEIESIHAELKQVGAIVVSERGDSGCNANWLAGVEASPTEWVTILHDDDILMPDFSSAVEQSTKSDVGFILWDARRHGMGYDDILPILDLPTGIYPTKKLFRNVMIDDSFTLSPTIGCFRRADLIATLTEAQERLGSEYHLRPTMMVGNDLLIWLRAIEKHRYFKYIKAPLTSFGHHPGSTTCDEVFNRRGRLGPIYNRVRKHFLKTFQRIIHVVPRYQSTGETQRRIEFAAASWQTLYASGMVTPCHVWNAARNSTSIGDQRRTPFLKDVLKAGISASNPGDIVMLSNDDDVLHPDLPWYLFDTMLSESAMCAFRQSFQRGNCPSLKTHRDFFKEEAHDWGRDLFAFRRDWLEQHMPTIPDYVLGASDWDSTLATLIRMSKGMPVTRETWVSRDPLSELPTGFVYHEAHQAVWSTPENRLLLPGNIHNRKLTLEFIAKHGVGWFV